MGRQGGRRGARAGGATLRALSLAAAATVAAATVAAAQPSPPGAATGGAVAGPAASPERAAAALERSGVEPSFRFIGNSGFEVSDGETILLLDFPYVSGAFDYMTFPAGELRARPGALCVFTHLHDDHFDPTALAAVGCAVAGPREAQALAPAAARLGDGPVWTLGAATVRCLPTPHAGREHCSYLVDWGRRRWFVSGDVESLEALDGIAGPLDALFLPAWLISPAAEERARRLGARIVVHHHAPGEKVARCGGCLVPRQGSAFTLRGD